MKRALLSVETKNQKMNNSHTLKHIPSNGNNQSSRKVIRYSWVFAIEIKLVTKA